MNPNAPEFKPPSKGQAWSNPAKSVHIAKLPPRRQLEENHDQVKDGIFQVYVLKTIHLHKIFEIGAKYLC